MCFVGDRKRARTRARAIYTYIDHNQVRNAGVRAVLQQECTSWEQVVAFLEESNLEKEETYQVILKPTESAGSGEIL